MWSSIPSFKQQHVSPTYLHNFAFNDIYYVFRKFAWVMSFFAEYFKQNWRRFMKVFHIIAYSQESDWIPPTPPYHPTPYTPVWRQHWCPARKHQLLPSHASILSYNEHVIMLTPHPPTPQGNPCARNPISSLCPPTYHLASVHHLFPRSVCTRANYSSLYIPSPCILTPPHFSWHIPTYNHPSKFWSEGPSKYSPVIDNLSHPYTLSALASMPDMGTHSIFR